MDIAEKISRLRLFRTDNIGPITFYKLLQRYGSAMAAIKALPDLAKRGGRLANIKICSIEAAEKEINNIEKFGAQLLAQGEKGYPELLAQIEDAPPLITVFGNIDALAKPALAVVGARNSSTVGRKIAEEYSAVVSKAGFNIVSGLARGIDTAAHRASLTGGTIAVVAGGIDVIYPKENKELFYEIAQNGGAIVAESPFGTEPIARHFPKRNRIISGLSLGTLVVEAALKSGSLITARTALEQNREVFAIPGSPKDPRSSGTNKLIKDGAHMVTSADDIISELKSLRYRPMFDSAKNQLEGELPLELLPEDNALLDSDEVYEKILSSLSYTPIHIDEIIRSIDAPVAEVLTAILELELSGSVERQIGNKILLA